MSAVCLHRLWNEATGLVCQRPDAYTTGHTYVGISVDDGRHDDRTEEA